VNDTKVLADVRYQVELILSEILPAFSCKSPHDLRAGELRRSSELLEYLL